MVVRRLGASPPVRVFAGLNTIKASLVVDGRKCPPYPTCLARDWTQVPETGNTGLHLASYCGRVKCLEYLHTQGGDLTKKNHHGQTPAMLAALTGRTEVLEWLLNTAKSTADTPNQPFPEVYSKVYYCRE